MTLRTRSPRIDPVAVSVDGEGVVACQQCRQGGKVVEAVIAGSPPRVLEDDDGGGVAALEIARELVPEGQDARIGLIVEEVEVVQEAGGLTQVEAQERVHAAAGHVHHLHRTRAGQRYQIADERSDAALLVGYPWRVGRVHALGAEEHYGKPEDGEGEPARERGRPEPS